MAKLCPLCKTPVKDDYEDAIQKLGLTGWPKKDITESVIKKAYKSIVRSCHPDIGGDESVFKDITEARDHLKEALRSDELPREDTGDQLSDEAKKILKERVSRCITKKMCPLCGKKMKNKSK